MGLSVVLLLLILKFGWKYLSKIFNARLTLEYFFTLLYYYQYSSSTTENNTDNTQLGQIFKGKT